MRAYWLLFGILVSVWLARAADICNPADLYGSYAFQLTGLTTISGEPKPTASLGRLAFDGQGGLKGTTSAAFSGFLLGNPTTGSYEANTDCSVKWKLQDDSGGYQQFTGRLSADGAEMQFRQVGGPDHGIMRKTPDSCSNDNLQKQYKYVVSGSTTPMKDGDVARSVSTSGTLNVAENGTFRVDDDCSVQFDLGIETKGGEPLLVSMRGFLVNGGREILAIQTDPGAMVAGRLTAAAQ